MSREEIFTFKIVFVCVEGEVEIRKAGGGVLGTWSPIRGLCTPGAGSWLSADRDVEHRVVHQCVREWSNAREKKGQL